MNKLQEKELIKKINLKVMEHQKSHNNFIEELELYIPSDFFRKRIIENFLKRHNERIRKIMLSNQVEFENLIQ